MKISMKVMYSNGDIFVIQVKEELYYYGDGKKINAFGQNAVQFLRFNPYLKDVSNQRIAIPDSIAKEIASHLETRKSNEGIEQGHNA